MITRWVCGLIMGSLGLNSILYLLPFCLRCITGQGRIVKKLCSVWHLFCLQTNKSTCHKFTDASRRHQSPGSETNTKDFIIHSTRRILSFMFLLVPPALQAPLGSMWSNPRGYCTKSGFASQLRTLSFQNQICDWALLENYLKYPFSQRYYLYYHVQQTNLTSALEGDAISSKGICYSF